MNLQKLVGDGCACGVPCQNAPQRTSKTAPVVAWKLGHSTQKPKRPIEDQPIVVIRTSLWPLSVGAPPPNNREKPQGKIAKPKTLLQGALETPSKRTARAAFQGP